MTEGPKILYCHCAFAQVIPNEVKQAVLDKLLQSNTKFETVPDLCEMSARKDPILQSLCRRNKHSYSCLLQKSCVRTFSFCWLSPSKEGPQIINMRVLNAEEAINTLLANDLPSDTISSVTAQTEEVS